MPACSSCVIEYNRAETAYDKLAMIHYVAMDDILSIELVL